MHRFRPTAGLPELLTELRIDRIKDPDLEGLLLHKQGRVIATNRKRDEGGCFRGTEEERVGMLIEAAALGADFVDIEASTAGHLIRRLKEEIGGRDSGAGLIVSHHDFIGTPSERLLRKRFDDCSAWKPDIVKLVTMARRVEDNLKVLRLIPYARSRGFEIVAFCMGRTGRVSRVASPFLGAYLTFAAASENEESAPGQLTLGEMMDLYLILDHGDTAPQSTPGTQRITSV
jgi:3-dehydroquinate dehydratase type I